MSQNKLSVNAVETYLKKEMGFHTDTDFSKSQKEDVSRWVTVFNYDTDIIMYAYQLTVKNTGKCNFKYMNTVLDNWYSGGVRTVAEAKQYSENRKKKNLAKKRLSEHLEAAQKLYLALYDIYGDNLCDNLDEVIAANRSFARCSEITKRGGTHHD